MSTIVSEKYEGAELALLQSDELKKVWAANPLKINNHEKTAICLDVGIAVLNKKCLSPLEISGIKANQIASTILRNIEKEHSDALHYYEVLLREYTEKDEYIIEQNKSKYKIKSSFYPLYWILALLGVMKNSAELAKEEQTYRYLWFYKVHQTELTRMKRVKEVIENAFPKLIESLEDMFKQNLIHREICLEAWQLRIVYNKIFGTPSFHDGQCDRERLLAQNEAALQRLLPNEQIMEEMLKDYIKDNQEGVTLC